MSFRKTDQKILDLFKAKDYKGSYELMKSLCKDAFEDKGDLGRTVVKHLDRLIYNTQCITQKYSGNEIKLAVVMDRSPSEWAPDILNITHTAKDLVLFTEQLAKHYQVTVFAKPPKNSIYKLPLLNPRYALPEESTEKYDIIIGWNTWNIYGFLQFRKPQGDVKQSDVKQGNVKQDNSPNKHGNTKCPFYLYINGNPSGYLVPEALQEITGVIFTCESYRKKMLLEHPKLCDIPSFTLEFTPMLNPNTLNITDFTKKQKACVFASKPGLSLKLLLEFWGFIRKRVPEATLEILEAGGYVINSEFNELHKAVKTLKEQGIFLQKDAIETYKKSSLILLPSLTTECQLNCSITTAMSYGCIPVAFDKSCINRIPEDFLIKTDNSEDYKQYLSKYIETVVFYLRLSPKELFEFSGKTKVFVENSKHIAQSEKFNNLIKEINTRCKSNSDPEIENKDGFNTGLKSGPGNGLGFKNGTGFKDTHITAKPDTTALEQTSQIFRFDLEIKGDRKDDFSIKT